MNPRRVHPSPTFPLFPAVADPAPAHVSGLARRWLTALLVLPLILFANAPRTQKTMNPTTRHHLVTFPDCRLQFDYPADLRPSPDFVRQRLASQVDYATIRWRTASASDSFVEMHSDIAGTGESGSLATVSVEMWLCAAAPDFTGDVREPSDLRRANVELDQAEHLAVSALTAVEIRGRTWLYRTAGANYLIGLNRRIYLSARVSVVGASDDAAAREHAAAVRDTIIGSLELDLLQPAMTPAASHE